MLYNPLFYLISAISIKDYTQLSTMDVDIFIVEMHESFSSFLKKDLKGNPFQALNDLIQH